MEEITPRPGAIDRSPQDLLVGNELIMRTIMSFVVAREDLLNCMLSCKSISDIPARLIYETCSAMEVGATWAAGASIVSETLMIRPPWPKTAD